jgi:O-6-methylguanine DNA methyltransferase
MRQILELLLQIPKGRVTTYQELARAAGTGPRAVGSVMRSNRQPGFYPCYKVINSTGHVGEYSGPGGVQEKIRRLRADGVEVVNGRVDLERFMFRF